MYRVLVSGWWIDMHVVCIYASYVEIMMVGWDMDDWYVYILCWDNMYGLVYMLLVCCTCYWYFCIVRWYNGDGL